MDTLVSDPNALTKDRLRAELKKHNIPLPASDAKKSAYVELYRSQLLDQSSANVSVDPSAFSSDEEIEFKTTSARKKKLVTPSKKAPSKKSSMPELLDITSLSDEELAARLQELGVAIGPILDTTRRVYQKKLEKLLSQKKYDVSIKQLPPSEEFSDHTQDEDEEPEPPKPVKRSPRKKSPARSEKFDRPEYKRPPLKSSYTISSTVEPVERTNITASYNSFNHSSVTHRQVTRDAVDSPLLPKPQKESIVTQAAPPVIEKKKVEKKERRIPMWVQVLIFIIFAVLIFLIIQNMEPATINPFKNLITSK